MKKLILKIHMWLAIPFGTIISILCLTGAILVFETEIKQWTQPSLYKASQATDNPLPLAELMARATEQLPDTVIVSSIQIPTAPNHNYRLAVAGGTRTSILIDPYTGDVKGSVRPYAKGSFFTFVRKLHRWFLFEIKREGVSWGKLVTGSSTLVFVFILLSGIIIWIPRTWNGLRKRLSIKADGGRFRFWHDFHLAGGQAVSLLLLVMALTGLTWSFNWYRTGFYKVFGAEISRNTDSHGANTQGTGRDGTPQRTHALSGITDRPRVEGNHSGGVDRSPIDSDRSAIHDSVNDNSAGRSAEPSDSRHGIRAGVVTPVELMVWEEVAATLLSAYPGCRNVTVQSGSASVSINRYGNTRATDSYSFDPASGRITEVKYYRDLPKSGKIRGWIYSVHVGSWGGIATRILYFVACIVGTALPVTGYYIWLKKRRKKWFGPRAARHRATVK